MEVANPITKYLPTAFSRLPMSTLAGGTPEFPDDLGELMWVLCLSWAPGGKTNPDYPRRVHLLLHSLSLTNGLPLMLRYT